MQDTRTRPSKGTESAGGKGSSRRHQKKQNGKQHLEWIANKSDKTLNESKEKDTATLKQAVRRKSPPKRENGSTGGLPDEASLLR